VGICLREAYERLEKFEPKNEHDELRKSGTLKGLWEALCYIRVKGKRALLRGGEKK
jgi:hypothetical protein